MRIIGAREFEPPTFPIHRNALTTLRYAPIAMCIELFEEISGREDLNLRPRAPEARALTGLRYAPS